MTFEEFLEEKNLTPENTPGSEHALMQEAYNAGYEAGKKYAIAWHKIDSKEPANSVLVVGKRCLIRFQDCDADNENYCRCFTSDESDDSYGRVKQ